MMRSLSILLLFCACENVSIHAPQVIPPDPDRVYSGLDRLELSGFALLSGMNVGLVMNHTSLNHEGVSLDQLLLNHLEIRFKAIFTPEHGLTGQRSAGEAIESIPGKIPILSPYGAKKKPDPSDLDGIDALVFDLQDGRARYYTYSSTLFYLMEAAEEQGVTVIVLDRPWAGKERCSFLIC